MTSAFPDWLPLTPGVAAPELESLAGRGGRLVLVAPGRTDAGAWVPEFVLDLARRWAESHALPVRLLDASLDAPLLDGLLPPDGLGEGVTDAVLFGASLDRVTVPMPGGIGVVPSGTPTGSTRSVLASAAWTDFWTDCGSEGLALALVPVDQPGWLELADQAEGLVVLGWPGVARSLPPDIANRVLAVVGPASLAEEPAFGPAPLEPPADLDLDAEPEPEDLIDQVVKGLEEEAVPQGRADAPGGKSREVDGTEAAAPDAWGDLGGAFSLRSEFASPAGPEDAEGDRLSERREVEDRGAGPPGWAGEYEVERVVLGPEPEEPRRPAMGGVVSRHSPTLEKAEEGPSPPPEGPTRSPEQRPMPSRASGSKSSRAERQATPVRRLLLLVLLLILLLAIWMGWIELPGLGAMETEPTLELALRTFRTLTVGS